MNRAAALSSAERGNLLALANNGPEWSECLNAWLESGYPYAVVIAKDGRGPVLMIAADRKALAAAAEFANHALGGDLCEWSVSESVLDAVGPLVLANFETRGRA
jgi:hypothetical protein